MKIAPFTKTFGGRTVLSFPGFEPEKGKIYAVIGANGSGKSTFAKVLAGAVPADKKAKPLSGVSVGYMPQKNYGFRMSVKANVLLNGSDISRAEKLMDALGLRHLEKERGDKLSGGETARMALARLMMGSYDMLILDEPTSAMDMESTLLSEKLIREYVEETGCALILVTHSLQQARRLADEALYFHKGSLIEHSRAEKLLFAPEEPETKQFLDFYGN